MACMNHHHMEMNRRSRCRREQNQNFIENYWIRKVLYQCRLDICLFVVDIALMQTCEYDVLWASVENSMDITTGIQAYHRHRQLLTAKAAHIALMRDLCACDVS